MPQAFPSVEAMLEPAELSSLLGRPVETVDRAPMVPKGHSSTGARFDGVRIDGELAPSLVIKSIQRGTDWVAIVTGDRVDREVAIWESGLLDRLPDGMGYPVVAGARSTDGSSLLMHNLESQLLTDGQAISPEWNSGLLRSLASMHAAFWQHPLLVRPGPALCSLGRLLAHLGPRGVPELKQTVRGHFIIGLIEDGWTTLPALVGADLTDRLRALVVEPTEVCRALAAYPHTLLHGDVRPPNVACDAERATLIDWARPCAGPPAIDLAYYLLMLLQTAPTPPDDAAEEYLGLLRSSLGGSRSSWSWWDDQLDVCFAAVFAMMAAVIVRDEVQHRSAAELTSPGIGWWAERAERGLRVIDRA